MYDNFKNIYQFNFSIRPTIVKISNPLMDNFGIDFLSYRKFCKNGELIYIVNHQNWMDFSFDKMWIHSESFYKRIPLLSSNGFFNYIWPNLPNGNDSIYKSMHEHNINNGINMYKEDSNCVEIFAFSSNNDQKIIQDLYVNNIYILDRFILYFREMIHHIIKSIDHSCIIKHNALNNYIDDDHSLSKFFKQTQYKRFYLMLNNKETYISMKETECISLLSKGKTIKEIGRILNISPRTVETHINNAKARTDIQTTSSLIDIFTKEKRKYQNSI